MHNRTTAGRGDSRPVLLPSYDPLGVMQAALAGAPLVPNAEDTFLHWILTLPGNLDPAYAARAVNDYYGDSPAASSGDFHSRLRALLVELTAHPGSRLARPRKRSRRRATTVPLVLNDEA